MIVSMNDQPAFAGTECASERLCIGPVPIFVSLSVDKDDPQGAVTAVLQTISNVKPETEQRPRQREWRELNAT